VRSAAPAEAAVVAPSLAIARDFPDPDVVRFGRTYYAYSTQQRPNVPVATASSVTGPWTAAGDALPRLGAWASGGLTWAPDVVAAGRRALPALLHGPQHRDQPAVHRGPPWRVHRWGRSSRSGPARWCATRATPADIDPSSFVDTDGRAVSAVQERRELGRWHHVRSGCRRWRPTGWASSAAGTALIRDDRAEEAGVIEAPTLVQAQRVVRALLLRRRLRRGRVLHQLRLREHARRAVPEGVPAVGHDGEPQRYGPWPGRAGHRHGRTART
jgi:hypothetical protein